METAARFHLSGKEARAIIAAQLAVVHRDVGPIRQEAGMTQVGRNLLWRRQVVSPFALVGLDPALKMLAAQSPWERASSAS